MVRYHPVRFGGHGHCGSGDIMLLVVEIKFPHVLASIRHFCLSLKHMAYHAHTHEISGRRHNN